MKSYSFDEVKRMQKILKILDENVKITEELDNNLSLLDELIGLLASLDQAKNFCKIGGVVFIY